MTETDKTPDVDNQPSVDPALLEERKKIVDKVNNLLQSDGPAVSCAITLLASRQLYYTALAALNERMKELGHADDIEKVIVESMAEAAMKPFEPVTVIDKLQKHTLPWLQARIHSENEREREAVKQERIAADEQRRLDDLPMPAGFSWKRNEVVLDTLPRNRPLVLAGNARTVRHLLAAVEHSIRRTTKRAAGGAGLTCLRFSSDWSLGLVGGKKTPPRYLPVPYPTWSRKVTSRKALADIMSRYVARLKNQQIDLLLIDDISQLGKPLITTRFKAVDHRAVAEVLPHVRRCAEMFGCGVVAGLPTRANPTDDIPDFDDGDWRGIAGGCDLQWVQCEDAGHDDDYECEVYRIKIGDSTVVDAVDKKQIDWS